MIPRPTAPVAWGRIDYELFDDGKHILPLSARYYRKPRDTKAQRTMTFSGSKELGGRVIPTRVEVTVADKPGEYTRITYTEIKYDVKIPASKFTEQALRK
jgi:outer membrane lipoprotein-sorting protein